VVHTTIPEMGFPPDVDALTFNVETLLNVARARSGTPVTHRHVSVIGEVAHPAVYRVPIGTPVDDVVRSAGGATCSAPVFLLGGVMMGRLAESGEEPITKTNGGLYILPQDHPLVSIYRRSVTHRMSEARSACTQCVLCTEACSRNTLGHRLYPHKIMRLADLQLHEDSPLARSVFLCSECGCCEFACPMGLSPRRVIQGLKANLRRRGISYDPGRFSPRAREFRDIRHLPAERIVARYGLTKYQRTLQLSDEKIKPARVRIATKQHIGAAAEPVVSAGDRVKTGDLIARIRDNQLGANVHSSICGRVMEVNAAYVVITAGEGS